MTPLLLIIGGSLGTLARYYAADRVGMWTNSGAFGIFAVNIAGSFAIGLFLTLGEGRVSISSEARILVAVGFLGAFTTFSTLTWQTLQLMEIRDYGAAALNVAGSLIVGMLAVWAGAGVARVAA